MRQFDVAVVGAGAAGLSLTHRLAASNRAAGRRLGIALVEPPPGPARPPERTWCYWERGVGRWDPVLAARWERLAVVGADGRRRVHRTAPFSYKMLRSRDFEKYVAATAVEGVTVLRATVAEVADGAERAVVRAVDGAGAPVEIAATWVFDSRPAAPPPGRTALLQHFRGWFARTPHDAFDPSGAVLMDLRTPQPARGVSFGYVLPLSPREALVEYTEFTREALDTPAYEAALRDYTGRVLKLREVEVTAAEQGAIPMTDARFPTRAGRRVFRIGAAGAPRGPPPATPSAGSSARRRPWRGPWSAAPSPCRRRRTGAATWPWTRCCCAPWTPAGSTGRRSSPGCSTARRCPRCWTSSTAPPTRCANSRSACAPRWRPWP